MSTWDGIRLWVLYVELIFMIVVTLCTYVAYVPQLYKILKTRCAEDLAVFSRILWCVRPHLIQSIL